MQRLPTIAAAAVVAVAVAATSGLTTHFATLNPIPPAAAADNVSSVGQSGRLAYEQNTIDIVKKYGPSVAAISVTVEGKRVNPLKNLPPRLRQFFEQFGGNGNQFSQNQKYTERAAGSGFVVNKQGEILTNYHVIAPALKDNSIDLKPSASITVHFAGEKKDLAVEVVGADISYDLALLRLKKPDERPQDAKPIPLADSDNVEVGEKAIAIGNPFTLQSTVTTGIVSAINRRQGAEVSGVPINYIQTDAAINPGNSGGPLIDSQGKVIGVNNEILAPNGTFVGVGFAIPSNLVQKRLSKLEAGGLHAKAQLGIAIADVSDLPQSVRKFLHLPDYGVMVLAVAKNSPADKAGIVPAQYAVTRNGHKFPAGGDVILEAEGKKISTAEDLQDIVYAHKAGQTLHLQVLRDGKKVSVDVKLAVVRREQNGG